MNFTFEEAPWERAMATWQGRVSAVQFLTLLEPEDELAVEDAFEALKDRCIELDIEDLPKQGATGEAAVRLRREEQLVKSGDLLRDLEETDPLRLYLQELAATPACGDVEILAMQDDEASRNMLVNLSLSRVVELAMERTGYGVLLLDLIQEGSMGLWESILSWQGQGDFKSHRDWHIRQAMARFITLNARNDGVGRKMRQAMEDYRSVDEKLLVELGRNPTLEEIADAMHITADEAAVVASTMEAARTVSRAKAPEQAPEDDPEEQQAVEDTAYFQTRQRIAELLSGLPEEDAKLLSLRFGLEGGLPLSPEETGKRMNLTPEEVVAREAAALAKLRG